MSRAPIILLPPSEGKSPGGRRRPWNPALGRFPQLADQRAQVAAALMTQEGGTGKMLGCRGDTLNRAREANAALIGAPTLPAWRRFTGVVWNHLDVSSFSPQLQRQMSRRVLVISALAGVSQLDDPLPDFRLKLSARLEPLGPLAAWWRPAVSATLNQHLSGRTVFDLLPQEHRAAWTPDLDRMDLRRIDLVDSSGVAIGHNAKAAKGLLARRLLLADADVDATGVDGANSWDGANEAERALDEFEHEGLRVRWTQL